MIKFNEIELDYESRKKVLSKVPAEFLEIEMSEFDSAFLCGLLKKFKPKKIVEIGVAGGGSTAVMLQCLEDIGQEYVMNSIDFSSKYHLNKEKDTGYTLKYVQENNLIIPPPPHTNYCGTHTLRLDTILPFVIDEIGNEIDFVILDTAHVLPGEILDFLAVLPYLSKNAVVVLHDTMENQRLFHQDTQHATTILFSSVVANKFFNYQPNYIDLIYHYADIAAFQINEHTFENIENVFLTLTLRWQYWPARNHTRAYYNIYEKHYSPELCKLFEEILKMNFINLRMEYAIEKYGKVKN